MAICYAPPAGTILICDFKNGIHPEICKKRPVVVISGANKRHNLVTVVPLSTTQPSPIQGWHCLVSTNLPAPFHGSAHAYAKCDLVTSVSYQRLDLFYNGKDHNGKRIYITPTVSQIEFTQICEGIKEFLQI